MKYVFGLFLATFFFTISTFASSDMIVGNDADEHGCIGSAGYVWNDTSKMCERPWEKKIYTTSEAFLKAEGLTCKVATDGCNTVQIVNGNLGAMTKMYCENIYGSGANEQWSCLDKQIEENTIGFLTSDEQTEYKSIQKSLSKKIQTEVVEAINNFGDKALEKTNYDIVRASKVVDKAIERVNYRLMTSKYSNKKTYNIIKLLGYELRIMQHRWEVNSTTTTSN